MLNHSEGCNGHFEAGTDLGYFNSKFQVEGIESAGSRELKLKHHVSF